MHSIFFFGSYLMHSIWFINFDFLLCKTLEKLHCIILNYTQNYILHFKLFEYTYCTISYDFYYILHIDIKFAINLDEKVWYYVKI